MHHPVFWCFGGLESGVLEQRIADYCDSLLHKMARREVKTLGQSLTMILIAPLCLSQNDADLVRPPRFVAQ